MWNVLYTTEYILERTKIYGFNFYVPAFSKAFVVLKYERKTRWLTLAYLYPPVLRSSSYFSTRSVSASSFPLSSHLLRKYGNADGEGAWKRGSSGIFTILKANCVKYIPRFPKAQASWGSLSTPSADVAFSTPHNPPEKRGSGTRCRSSFEKS